MDNQSDKVLEEEEEEEEEEERMKRGYFWEI